MKIKNSKFVVSVAQSNKLLSDEKQQIAFVGRSNVGKSSLINMLTNNSKLCKTSQTPGRTRLVNYFEINNEFYFVDLPGYGYAKASAKEVVNWQGLIEPYLLDNYMLKCVCVLVDVRHEPTVLDSQMINFLFHYQIPFIIIATKCDKLAKSKVKPQISKLANALKVGVGNIFPTSFSGFGKEELLIKLHQFLVDDNAEF